MKRFERLKPPAKSEARRDTGRRKANNRRRKGQAKGRKYQLPSVTEYFGNPSLVTNPDDQRIYRLLVEGGFLAAPRQLELGSCFKETPLATWMRKQQRKKRTAISR